MGEIARAVAGTWPRSQLGYSPGVVLVYSRPQVVDEATVRRLGWMCGEGTSGSRARFHGFSHPSIQPLHIVLVFSTPWPGNSGTGLRYMMEPFVTGGRGSWGDTPLDDLAAYGHIPHVFDGSRGTPLIRSSSVEAQETSFSFVLPGPCTPIGCRAASPSTALLRDSALIWSHPLLLSRAPLSLFSALVPMAHPPPSGRLDSSPLHRCQSPRRYLARRPSATSTCSYNLAPPLPPPF